MPSPVLKDAGPFYKLSTRSGCWTHTFSMARTNICDVIFMLIFSVPIRFNLSFLATPCPNLLFWRVRSMSWPPYSWYTKLAQMFGLSNQTLGGRQNYGFAFGKSQSDLIKMKMVSNKSLYCSSLFLIKK